MKLRADTHRGLRGRVERGLSGGGCPYGYRSVRVDPDGGSGSRLEVDAEAAAVGRRIFEHYAKGQGLRAIAHTLNADGIAPPRPRAMTGAARRSWAPSAIRDMLRNPIYRGECIWNRSEWLKGHETGKRRRFERPESQWIRRRDEALRIVSEAEWEGVRARLRVRRSSIPRDAGGRLRGPGEGRRNHRGSQMLSGMLACGVCGGPFFAVNGSSRYGCGWHRDRGAHMCANAKRVGRADVEARILEATRRLMTAECVGNVAERASTSRSRSASTPPAARLPAGGSWWSARRP